MVVLNIVMFELYTLIELLGDCLITSNLVSVGDNLFENSMEPLAGGNVWCQLWFIAVRT